MGGVKMKSVTLDEFVELSMQNGYKSISIDLKTKSVRVLIGYKRVEATELVYEVRINA